MPDEHDEAAARWWVLADALLPGTDRLPPPSAVEGAGSWTRRLLSIRPDLCAAVTRATSADEPSAHFADLADLADLATVVAGAHYLSPVVRHLIGYPGQEPRALTEREDGLDEALLRAVRAPSS